MTSTADDRPLDDVTNDVTAEYVAIDEAPMPESPEAGLEAAADAADAPTEATAESWFVRLEREVAQLHEKWEDVDAEIQARDIWIGELREEIRTRDAAVVELKEELRAAVSAIDEAESRVREKEAEMAFVAGVREELEQSALEAQASLESAAEQRQAAEREVTSLRSEIARLEGDLQTERAGAAEAAERNQVLLHEQNTLRSKVQDLESYIDARHKDWGELRSRLGDYKQRLADLNATIKAKDALVGKHDEEKRRLGARIADLERESAELLGRRKEKEAAYEELRKKLKEQIDANELLEASYAARAKETEQAVAKAVSEQKLVESLQHGIARRDENLAVLTTDLESERAAAAELAASRVQLVNRVGGLERGLQEHAEQVQALRDELKTSNQRLRAAEESLAERDRQLAESRAIGDERARAAERLAANLAEHQQSLSHFELTLTRAEARAEQADKLVEEAAHERARLEAELAAQGEVVARLEAELRAKKATADLLERSASRIASLGQSLAALDRRVKAHPLPAHATPELEAVTLTAHIDTRKRSEARDADPGEMLPIQALLGSEATRAQSDDAPGRSLDRKLVAIIGGEGTDYPISKAEMTIGRGHGCDIRIPSHYVSRTHAKISTQGIATVIEDAGSKNGLLVNHERVRRRVLRDGDIVSLGGELDLRFVDMGP